MFEQDPHEEERFNTDAATHVTCDTAGKGVYTNHTQLSLLLSHNNVPCCPDTNMGRNLVEGMQGSEQWCDH